MIEALPRDLEKALAEFGLPPPPAPPIQRPPPVAGWTPAFKGQQPPF